MPRMLRNVSCWPAKDASGRSSAVALERTAKDDVRVVRRPAASYAAADVGLEVRRERLLDDRVADRSCRRSASSRDVVGVELGELRVDRLGQPGRRR